MGILSPGQPKMFFRKIAPAKGNEIRLKQDSVTSRYKFFQSAEKFELCSNCLGDFGLVVIKASG